MLKSLLRVRFAALLAAFTGQSRKRGRQTKGKAVGYALLMLYCFCAFVFLFYSSFSQLAEAFFPAGLGWLYFAMFAIMAFALMFIGSVFTAKSQLFEAKDNELLLSMPVRPGLILLSRMAAMLACRALKKFLCHERQKTCGLRHNASGIDRNSCAESSADGRSVCHRQRHQPASREGRGGRCRRIFASEFP